MGNIIHIPVKVETINLKILYDLCNELFKDKEECFFTSDEVKKMKQEKSKIFLQ